MKPTKEEIAKRYREALGRCVEGFSRLDDKEWNKKASEHWTAKEHLAHLVSNAEDEMLVITRQAIAGQPASVPGFEKQSDAVAFHNAGVEKVRGLPVAELVTRLDSAFSTHISMLEEVEEGILDKPASSPAWSREGTLRDAFNAGYLFLPGQYQQIRRVSKKKLPHWLDGGPPERVNFHLDRLYNYMALIFRPDKADDLQAIYLMTMEGPGGGQWRLKINDGTAYCEDGEGFEHDVEIKTKPEHWMDLASGDLNPPMAIMTRKVKLGGNASLAMKLGGLFGGGE
ncbi:MAG TPA: SCP2 sterol-binding domain-containing protein [Dehalococcoidia bacterium]|jgi:putative sterol carrier protein|nr:SCP2 sterol-binding domain-containing protein [Dehalococcoidia bacterium]